MALGLFIPGIAPRGTLTVIVAIFFFSGVQLMFIGMLGEYITAIHAQVRRGPMVVERERINIDEPPPEACAPPAMGEAGLRDTAPFIHEHDG